MEDIGGYFIYEILSPFPEVCWAPLHGSTILDPTEEKFYIVSTKRFHVDDYNQVADWQKKRKWSKENKNLSKIFVSDAFLQFPFSGVGYTVVLIALYVDFYYNVIIAWALHYFLVSFMSLTATGGDLPWTRCGQRWNTANCSSQARSSEDGYTSPANEYFK